MKQVLVTNGLNGVLSTDIGHYPYLFDTWYRENASKYPDDDIYQLWKRYRKNVKHCKEQEEEEKKLTELIPIQANIMVNRGLKFKDASFVFQ